MKNIGEIVAEFVVQVKTILGERISKIILYGSYARGDYNENSDIDIIILSSLNDEQIERVETEIFDIAFDFQMLYGVEISVILKNIEHFNYWLGALPFYDNIQREGVVLSA